MRSISTGFERRLVTTVTPEMAVDFPHLGADHQVYATYWMARHFEEVGRMVLVPHLEDGEQGVGTTVHVEHLASAPVGRRVTVTARHRETSRNRLTVDCEARTDDGNLVGRGWTEQAVLPAAELQHKLYGNTAHQ